MILRWASFALPLVVVGQIVEVRTKAEPYAVELVQNFFVLAGDDAPVPEQKCSWTAQNIAASEDVEGGWGVFASQQGAWRLFDINSTTTDCLCCVQAGELPKWVAESGDTWVFPLTTAGYSKTFEIDASARYVFVVASCSNAKVANVTGKLEVKHSYGYLPGLDYPKLKLYAVLGVLYTVLLVAWLLLMLRWWSQLFRMQFCMAAVLVLGLVEAAASYWFLADYNAMGLRKAPLLILAITTSICKSFFSYMLVLVAALGWGITRPTLDQCVVYKIWVLSFTYIVLEVIWEIAQNFRHERVVPVSLLLLCLFPISILNGLIFYWIFMALSNLMDDLEANKQTHKLKLFNKLWFLLVTIMAVAGLALAYQIYTISGQTHSEQVMTWANQWVFSDGVSHGLFLFGLAVMMFLWAPSRNSMSYAYSEQINMDPEAQADDDFWDNPPADDDPWEGPKGYEMKADFHPNGNGKHKSELELQLQNAKRMNRPCRSPPSLPPPQKTIGVPNGPSPSRNRRPKSWDASPQNPKKWSPAMAALPDNRRLAPRRSNDRRTVKSYISSIPPLS